MVTWISTKLLIHFTERLCEEIPWFSYMQSLLQTVNLPHYPPHWGYEFH